MYRLEPNDIQGMLAEAAKVLTQPKDKEVMRRLISSTHATEPAEWDKRRMAEMLAKAGKMHEAEMVLHDIEVPWMRADACLMMARALKEVGDDYNASCMLNVAVHQGHLGQDSEKEQDRLDASSVLAEVACYMHELGAVAAAKEMAETITDLVRREKFHAYLRQVEPPVEETEAAAQAEGAQDADLAKEQAEA